MINNLSDIQILHLTEILCRITEKFDKTFVFHQISQLDLEIIHNSREICIITNFIYRNIYITHIHIYIYIYIYIIYIIYYILCILYIIYLQYLQDGAAWLFQWFSENQMKGNINLLSLKVVVVKNY